MPFEPVIIKFTDSDFEVNDLQHSAWKAAKLVSISTYWNGDVAPESRRFTSHALWSHRNLYVRFETPRSEEMVLSDNPQIGQKTIGLWERDVCEIFIAPDRNRPKEYFEFEVAPTGEWLDLAIDVTSGERITDWDYRSGMEAAACIEQSRVLMSIKIPFEAFGCRPNAGDVWLGNIFRCVGRDPDRGYLAWSPTLTGEPNFHVPERFGRLIFDN